MRLKTSLLAGSETAKTAQLRRSSRGVLKDVETMLEVCKVGPPAADVKEIVTKEISSEKFVGFHQLSTI